MTSRIVDNTRGKRRTVYTVLLSVCLFLGVICACLLVALVLIGRNIAQQSLIKDCLLNNSTTSTTPSLSTSSPTNDFGYINDDTFQVDNETTNEISVKLTFNTTSTTDRILKYTESTTSTTITPDWRSGWRLPRNVKPIHYDLNINPNITDFTFSGRNNITIETLKPLIYFVLHGQSFNVTAVEIYTVETNEKIDVIHFHNDSLHQLWVVDLEDTLQPGKYYLIVDFDGSMIGKRNGLYTSNYLDENDNRRYIATTKFEPTYARQAFPCFDEPNFKAKFTVHISKPIGDGYIALSNMNEVKTSLLPELGKNTEMVTFNTSVPMSTYVLCFIVCDFKYKEDTINPVLGDPIKLRVYATPAQVSKTEFALGVAANVTNYYVDYFKIAYPLPKLDMIAIPDFVSGAMEHWGLVTYRETALLYDEEKSNAANKQRVATVVAHELAHMWFGNLVTLNWWNDLWLNEGFATYMQFKAVDKILKDWGMIDQFLIDQVHPVMNFDATLASHPIVQTVETPNQITEIFDDISYNKGAAVLRMLENAIGEEAFQNGIHTYLDKYKYGNAVTKNLWDELQNTNPDFNVQDVMDTWTVQMGYPVILVQKEKEKYILKQKRFLTDPESASESPPSIYNYKFTIPVTYVTDTAKKIETKLWFNKADNQVELNIPDTVKWIKINHKQSGYYRVNYTPTLWSNLTKEIKNLEISDRANLFDDSFALAKAGELKYSVPFELTNTLKDENDYVPWSTVINRLNELQVLLKSTQDVYSKYKKHAQTIVKPIYDVLQWEETSDEKHPNSLLRSRILNFACAFDLEECKTRTRNEFVNWIKNDTAIPVNLKGIVYAYGMEQASEEEWNLVFEKYMKEIDAQEKIRLLNGLASTKNLRLLQDLLEKAKNEAIVRSQDYFTCLKYISSNDVGTALVWDYVRENWLELVERFTINDRYLGHLIPAITSSFTTELKLDEMEMFFKKYPEAGAGEISRKKALENVKNNIKWIKNYQNEVKEWLDLNVAE